MTAGDIINQVRYKLKDIVTGAYKWSDTELVSYVDDGQREIFKRRPDSIMSGTSLTATYATTTVTGTGTTLDINDQFRQLLVDYVLSRALDKSSPEQAKIYNQRFYTNIVN